MLALENKYQGKAEFIIVDVDEPQGQELAQNFAVDSIPAFFVLDKHENVVNRMVGETSLDGLEELLKPALQ